MLFGILFKGTRDLGVFLVSYPRRLLRHYVLQRQRAPRSAIFPPFYIYWMLGTGSARIGNLCYKPIEVPWSFFAASLSPVASNPPESRLSASLRKCDALRRLVNMRLNRFRTAFKPNKAKPLQLSFTIALNQACAERQLSASVTIEYHFLHIICSMI
jgi:hypothetical protein